ncbi:hypothetical protein LPB41_20415 [Thalassospira sp. MA62]|nr:hypothetical protein [Thalassospira sp. MA62]
MQAKNIAAVAVPKSQITGSVCLTAQGKASGLYMSARGPVTGAQSGVYPFATTLTSIALGGQSTLAPPNVALPQMLPTATSWDIDLSQGSGAVVYTASGGAFNSMSVAKLASDGKLTPDFSYKVEDANGPSFVRTTVTSPAKQTYVAAILSGYNLAIIGLQAQDGQQVPGVSGLVGTSAAPVSVGRVCGDLSAGLPQTVSLFYKTDERVGPLTAGLDFRGKLSFATFDTKSNQLSTPVPLLGGAEIADFDLAVSGDCFCILASLANGMPLLATFDKTGKLRDSPDVLVGSWNNVGHWIASPTVIADPAATAPAFRFAFVEHGADQPVAVHAGQYAM